MTEQAQTRPEESFPSNALDEALDDMRAEPVAVPRRLAARVLAPLRQSVGTGWFAVAAPGPGSTSVAGGVVHVVARAAAGRVPGVRASSVRGGHDGLVVSCAVVYGVVIPDAVEAVRGAVRGALAEMAGLVDGPALPIDVLVDDVLVDDVLVDDVLV